LAEIKGNFPTAQPVPLDRSSAGEKESYMQKDVLIHDAGKSIDTYQYLGR